MSIQYCEHCDSNIDTNYEAEHFVNQEVQCKVCDAVFVSCVPIEDADYNKVLEKNYCTLCTHITVLPNADKIMENTHPHWNPQMNYLLGKTVPIERVNNDGEVIIKNEFYLDDDHSCDAWHIIKSAYQKHNVLEDLLTNIADTLNI